MKFSARVFWADESIRRRFPLHAKLARRYVGTLFTEACCERTFSVSGRLLDDLRRTLHSEIVAAFIEVGTNMKHHDITWMEVKEAVLKKRTDKKAAAVAAAAAAAAATAAAAVEHVADMDEED